MSGADKPTLTLTCVSVPSDRLDFEQGDPAGGPIYVWMKEAQATEAQGIFLNADSARQLFNWLGVQLHKGRLK